MTTAGRRADGMAVGTPAFVVGFAAEARIARRSGWPVGIGGATSAGAAAVARDLARAGATGLISFGLAGGLDPGPRAGTLVVANAVVAADQTVWPTDPALSARFGGQTGHLCLGLDRAVAPAAEKRRLFQETGAALVDMESAAVAAVAAEQGLPFAVVRAICDPADQDLPPAALVSLDPRGHIAVWALTRSLIRQPGQIGALLVLARQAGAARRALAACVAGLG